MPIQQRGNDIPTQSSDVKLASSLSIPKTISFKLVKDEKTSLSPEFLRELANIFDTDVFLETGTFLGETAAKAAEIFREVHTVELSRELYQKALQRFAAQKNVHIYHGDSSDLLRKILPTINGKVLFWLDGHYSEGNTAKGETNTPIINEIEAIRDSGIKDAVILIDDIRLFQPVTASLPQDSSLHGYPSVTKLYEAILEIDSTYQFCILSDIALAFPAAAACGISQVVKACTLSRLFDDNPARINDVLEAEVTIARAQGEELEALKGLHRIYISSEQYGLGAHYRLWYGLTLSGGQQYDAAYQEFIKAIQLGLNHWRLGWYLAQTLYMAGNIPLAKQAARSVIQLAPEFEDARLFVERLNTQPTVNSSQPNKREVLTIKSGADSLAQLCSAGLIKDGQPLRLHLGCGEQHFNGYVNIDYPQSEHMVQTKVAADIFADITLLDFPDNSVDEIRLHHVFEHFDRPKALALLIRWHAWLKVGGLLHIETPDMLGCARALLENKSYKTKQGVLRHAFGSHEATWAYHLDGWYKEKFEHILPQFGFTVQCRNEQWNVDPWLPNVHALAVKQRAISRADLLIAADAIMRESMVADVPGERSMAEVWSSMMRDALAAPSVPGPAPAGKFAIGGISIIDDSPAYDSVGYDNIDFQQNGEFNVIANFLEHRTAPVIFDVGANKGHWSKLVLEIRPEAMIYAFEPVPDTFRILQQTVTAPHAHLMNLAVSHEDGAKTFYYWNDSSETGEMSSLYRRPNIEKKMNASVKPLSVTSRRLDTLCRELGVEHINFLKIDTEGAELDVLHGAAELLKARRIEVLQFEYGGTYLDSQITLRRIYDLLLQNSYQVYRVIPSGLLHIPDWRDALENYRYANYIAVASSPGMTIADGLQPSSQQPDTSASHPGPSAVAVIFSKDRAMQLECTLRSFLHHCSDANQISLKVLYTASNTLHEAQYLQLKKMYPAVELVRETAFRNDTLSAFSAFQYVLFLVDDNIFVKDFNLKDATGALNRQQDAVGFSLRLGKNTNYCYPLNKPQNLPGFHDIGGELLKFDWTSAELDFNYPLEVSSSIYRTKDILPLLNTLDFKNPNTMEALLSLNTNLFKEHQKYLLCFKESVTFCAPLNMVQTVSKNRISNKQEYSAEHLFRLFRDGYRIDTAAYSGFTPNACHQEVELIFHKTGEERPTVSVIIPCYNQAEFLPDAVESVANQTFTDWECIIVNDGSPDNTSEVATSLIAKYPDKRIFLLEKENSGVAAARNMGINSSKGRYILPLDADDIIDCTTLQKLVNLLETDRDIKIAYCDYQTFGARREIVRNDEWDNNRIRFKNIPPYCSLYYREVWEAVGGYNTNMALGYEDWDFWVGCAEKSFNAKKVAEPLLLYRVKDESRHTKSLSHDAELKAQIISNHKSLYDAATVEWAKNILGTPSISLNDKLQGLYKDAQNLIAQRKTADAISRLKEILETYPDFAVAYNDLGVLYYEMGNKDDALNCYQKAVESDTNNITFKKNLADFYCMELGRMEDALSIYVNILRDNPADIETLLAIGSICLSQGENSNARIFYEKVAALDPANAVARQALTVLQGYAEHMPLQAHFLMIDRCNAKCVFCGGDYYKNGSKRQITLDKFKVMADNLHLEKFQAICLAGAGDPLLNKDLIDIINYTNEKYPDLSVAITTNGIALSSKTADRLLETKIKTINISINAATRDTYKKLMQVDEFDRICKNAAHISERRRLKGTGPELQFSCPVSRINIEELPTLVELAHRVGFDSINIMYCRFYPKSIRDLNVETEGYVLNNRDSLYFHQELSDKMVEKAKALALRYGIRFSHEPLFREPGNPQVCTWPETQLMVGFDGEIYPCGGGELHFKDKVEKGVYNFGNALTQRIEDFWNSDDYRALRASSKHCGTASIKECNECANIMCHSDIKSHIMAWEDFEDKQKGSEKDTDTVRDPLVSVIVPTYNRPDMLPGTLKSILNQTYRNLEIIVVNDAGNDVADIINSLDHSGKIVYIKHPVNKGLAAARNTGIKAARGKYIAYLDDDDLFYPDHLETLVSFLKNSDYKVAYTDAHRAHQEIRNGKYIVTKRDVPYSYDFDYDRILVTNFVPVLCFMHEKSCMDEVGLFDESLKRLEDWDMWIRLSRKFKFHHIRKITCEFNWRTDGTTMTSGKASEFVNARKAIAEKHSEPVKQISTPAPNTMPLSMKRSLVSIVILTFNQLKFTKECVESIRKHTPEQHEIIFVDNGSTDGTVKWLRQLAEDNTNYKLIENKKNLGFAKGCNQGITAASGEYIMLLNNDVVVTDRWLSGMLDCLNTSNDAGFVGPMTNNISGQQKVQSAIYKSPAELEEYAKSFMERNRHRRIPARRVVGFCMLFRHELAGEIGLLDESFGSGNFEDDDYCLRAVLAGYRNFIAGDVFIHHYGSQSFIGNKIDYSSAITGNKKIFNVKWNPAVLDNPTAKKIMTIKAVEKADELHQKERLDEAVELLLKEGLKCSPDDKGIYYTLSEMLIDAKQFNDALDVIKEMPEDEKDAKRLALSGYCKEGTGLDDEAMSYADHALSLNNAYPLALNLKGILAFKNYNKTEAEAFFKKAIESDNGYGDPYTNLGLLKWSTENKEEALDLLERGFILSPTNADNTNGYHSAASSVGAFARAEQVLKEANGLYPYNKRISYLLIDILIQQGKNKEAIKEIEEAMVLFGIEDGMLQAALEVRKRLDTEGTEKISKDRDTISLCMIVKNEREHLARCLKSVKPVVDEMIIVDTGSTDGTKEIALIFGAKVYDFQWTGSFSEARNFSIEKAGGKWIFVLDADEVISPYDYAELKGLVNIKKPAAYFFVTRNYVHRITTEEWKANDGRYRLEEAGSGWVPSIKARFFPNDSRIRFENPVHELLEPSIQRANIPLKETRIPVHHYGKLDLHKENEKFERYYELGKKKLVETGGDLQAITELAVQAGELNKYDEAVELWQQALNLNPKLPPAFLNLSHIYLQQGKFTESLNASKKAMALKPNFREAVANHALAELCIGDAKKSIALLEEVVRKNPEYLLSKSIMAAAYCCIGQKEKGLELFRELSQEYMGFIGILYDLAKKLILAGKHDYAISLLETVAGNINAPLEMLDLLNECYRLHEAPRTTLSTSSDMPPQERP